MRYVVLLVVLSVVLFSVTTLAATKDTGLVVKETHSLNEQTLTQRYDAPHSAITTGPTAIDSQLGVWFHAVQVQLQLDADRDGFASLFTLTFDADTNRHSQQVYGVIYLGTSNLFHALHTTQRFTLFGNSSVDDVTLDFDLRTGFAPMDYHILIELYDSHSDQLIAYANHTTFAALAYVPIESNNFDRHQDNVLVTEYHGGAIPPIWILCLFLYTAVRLKRRKSV